MKLKPKATSQELTQVRDVGELDDLLDVLRLDVGWAELRAVLLHQLQVVQRRLDKRKAHFKSKTSSS